MVAEPLHGLYRQSLPSVVIGSGIARHASFAGSPPLARVRPKAGRQTGQFQHGRSQGALGLQPLGDHQPYDDRRVVDAVVLSLLRLGEKLARQVALIQGKHARTQCGQAYYIDATDIGTRYWRKMIETMPTISTLSLAQKSSDKSENLRFSGRKHFSASWSSSGTPCHRTSAAIAVPPDHPKNYSALTVRERPPSQHRPPPAHNTHPHNRRILHHSW